MSDMRERIQNEATTLEALGLFRLKKVECESLQQQLTEANKVIEGNWQPMETAPINSDLPSIQEQS